MFLSQRFSPAAWASSADEVEACLPFYLSSSSNSRLPSVTLWPHVLRHACATHLLDEGFSLKAIGDHLGHRSTRSTRIYAKVDGKKLGQVADGGLSTLAEYLRTQAQPITAAWAKDRVNSLREVSNLRLGGLQ